MTLIFFNKIQIEYSLKLLQFVEEHLEDMNNILNVEPFPTTIDFVLINSDTTQESFVPLMFSAMYCLHIHWCALRVPITCFDVY